MSNITRAAIAAEMSHIAGRADLWIAAAEALLGREAGPDDVGVAVEAMQAECYTAVFSDNWADEAYGICERAVNSAGMRAVGG